MAIRAGDKAPLGSASPPRGGRGGEMGDRPAGPGHPSPPVGPGPGGGLWQTAGPHPCIAPRRAGSGGLWAACLLLLLPQPPLLLDWNRVAWAINWAGVGHCPADWAAGCRPRHPSCATLPAAAGPGPAPRFREGEEACGRPGGSAQGRRAQAGGLVKVRRSRGQNRWRNVTGESHRSFGGLS